MPTRTCVACRTTRPKRELIRIVRTPGGDVLQDPSGRLAGRGAYVCAEGACRATALAKGALARALSRAIPIDERTRLMTPTGTRPERPEMDNEGDDRGQE
ncbi:MAG: RNase P modulator RnpM [Candidatus Limnocylindrales bacterium]